MRQTLFVLSFLLIAIGGQAQETRAFLADRIIPISGPEIENGVLIIRGNKIVAVGAAGSVAIPDGIKVEKITGTIMPGLVDTHSHIGGGSGGDNSNPIQPDCRIWETLNAKDAGLRKAQAGGLTTVNVMPGSGHLLSGQTVYIKLRGSKTIEGLVIKDTTGWVMGGMKMANGTNSIRSAPFPGTRAKSAALIRAKYIKAQEYVAKIAAAGDDASKRPDRDLALEGLAEVLSGKRVVHHHTHRADDILTVLRLAKEFGFRVVLHHVSEGWKVAEEIAAAKAPCSIIVIDSPGGKLEAVDLRFETGAILEKAGVATAFHTDDGITDSRLFLRSAAFAVRAGMSRKGALEGLTLTAAKMLDLGHRVGSLEPGKDADFIVLSGEPLSVYTKVLQTWVEGKKVFDRSDPADRLFAVGGYGASDNQVMHTHCGWAGPHDDHDDEGEDK
ncbi:MAG: imidazolonepropionase-like amidohydrolase [Planctomycetota bacterium]|jgi:imidazolonepropionase-like amidohydrolase